MKKQKQSSIKSTQSFLRISEIREDSLIMDDGTLRAVIAVSSTNYDLKSESEQEALIAGYQRFLNALEFSVQILMQSRRVDITSYTEKLKNLMQKQTNELLRVQTQEYIEFINRLVENSNVMNKNFYCIVPYSTSIFSGNSSSFFSFFGSKSKAATQQASKKLENFAKSRTELDQRVTSVVSLLGSMGLRSVRLTTEELVQLLYNSYNFESGPTIEPGQLGEIKIIEQDKQN